MILFLTLLPIDMLCVWVDIGEEYISSPGTTLRGEVGTTSEGERKRISDTLGIGSGNWVLMI